jgi:hypothetical protein
MLAWGYVSHTELDTLAVGRRGVRSTLWFIVFDIQPLWASAPGWLRTCWRWSLPRGYTYSS